MACLYVAICKYQNGRHHVAGVMARSGSRRWRSAAALAGGLAAGASASNENSAGSSAYGVLAKWHAGNRKKLW
jgi:hypothetical protein